MLTTAGAEGRIDRSIPVDSMITRTHRHATNITRATGLGGTA
ncbi:hypothetical protein UO65_5938 [Actinokineospora spheciospongiae]|uniref:Uncharacterized protein n=1 Tax=Actinokineospora spheciospongiae TaxID=909613 RepID=W7IQF5_9PSEU|nr:hypothetical protein UO65_5938 [Actinokineospora spheciospongiae]